MLRHYLGKDKKRALKGSDSRPCGGSSPRSLSSHGVRIAYELCAPNGIHQAANCTLWVVGWGSWHVDFPRAGRPYHADVETSGREHSLISALSCGNGIDIGRHPGELIDERLLGQVLEVNLRH